MSAAPDKALSETEILTLSGIVEKVVNLKADTGFVALVVRQADHDKPITIIGEAVQASPGQILRAQGRWQQSEAWGRQFKATNITLLAPTTSEGLTSFLASGAIKGVGDSVAKKMIAHFGDELVQILDSAPERLIEVDGIGERTAKRIAQSWKEEHSTRDILMFLQSHGVRPARSRKILETYGDQAVPRLLNDPYLLARDVRGIGFQTADQLAESLGVERDAAVRRMAALNEALRQAADTGHTCASRQTILRNAGQLIKQPTNAIEEVIETAIEQKRLIETIIEGDSFLQLPELFTAEQGIAANLHALVRHEPNWPELTPDLDLDARLGVVLAESQREALKGVLGSRLTIITGGPGTGKTTLVRAIIEMLSSQKLKMALCAPTGRAARRLTESTGQDASTIHRLIEADPSRGFGRNAERPIEADLVIVDEVSMVDTLLMYGLLQAMPADAALILVGDVDQLPPVGPGQPLADLINSGLVATFRLTEIFRQAAESGIVRNAHAVISGQMPSFKSSNSPDCFGIRANNAKDAIEKLIELVRTRIPERFELDPINDIQVLTAINRGTTGTKMLNEQLQSVLNLHPSAILERGGIRFGVGDKVMQIENDNQREVYNGDVGRITAIDVRARIMDVQFEDKTLLYNHETLEQLQPAYAVTVHKSQGSEYPAVVLLLMREHGRMLRRQLLYTAMTRARQLLVIIAQGDALETAVTTPLPPRNSLLTSSLNEIWTKEQP